MPYRQSAERGEEFEEFWRDVHPRSFWVGLLNGSNAIELSYAEYERQWVPFEHRGQVDLWFETQVRGRFEFWGIAIYPAKASDTILYRRQMALTLPKEGKLLVSFDFDEAREVIGWPKV